MGGTNLDLYREQIQKAGGPFLDIRDKQFVVLQDAQAVRDFCLLPDASAPGVDNGSLCARCKTALQANATVAVSEKQEHLAMAIICSKSHSLCEPRQMTDLAKHLNSHAFQSRFFSESLEEAKLRAQKKLKPENCTSDEKERSGNALNPSSNSDPSADTGEPKDAADSDSKSQIGDESPQEQVLRSPRRKRRRTMTIRRFRIKIWRTSTNQSVIQSGLTMTVSAYATSYPTGTTTCGKPRVCGQSAREMIARNGGYF